MDGMNRNEFHLLDVETAPLLVKRRGMKRRSESLSKKKNSITSINGLNCPKVPTKLMAVPEDHNESIPTRRPTTLDIEMLNAEESPDDKNKAFTEIRDSKPIDPRFSRDIDPQTSKTHHLS